MLLSSTSKRRLTIAKEFYLHGYSHSMKKSLSDLMLAILNFDFCAETLIKTILIDSKIKIKKGRGFKTFGELIADLTANHSTLGYITELESLHKLRNDVQHHSIIPSEQEVSRHITTIRLFFDEVTQKIYDNSTSFDEISLAFFIRSEHEKTILAEMEKSYQLGNYNDTVYYSKQAAIYHVKLLRQNMGVPKPRGFSDPFLFSDFGDLREVGRTLEATVNCLNWIVDRICLREHHDEINQLLDGQLNHDHFWWYGQGMRRVEADQSEAEHIRNIVYACLTSTQDQIKQTELKSPFIYDLTVMETDSDKGTFCQVGFVSPSEIINAKITITKLTTQDEIDKKITFEHETLNIPKASGLHRIVIPALEKNRGYEINCQITDQDGNTDYAFYDFQGSTSN